MKNYYTLPKIAFISCGGTIGGEWSPMKDTVVPTKKGNIRLKEYLEEQVRLHKRLDFIDLFNKDSRDVLDKDRMIIFNTIKRLNAKGVHHFLITHGTFTMVETAAFLEKLIKQKSLKNVFVVLTGSMIPHTGFAPSDSQFNIGFAISKLSSMQTDEDSGTWVAMNGLCSRPFFIIKNVKKSSFKIKNKKS